MMKKRVVEIASEEAIPPFLHAQKQIQCLPVRKQDHHS